jgi:hypothetical protein
VIILYGLRRIPIFFCRFIFLFIILFSSCSYLSAQEAAKWRYWPNGLGPAGYWIFSRASEPEIDDVKRRWDEIGESLKTTSNPFAGTYFQSGNRGYFLRWSPEAGFVYALYYEYFVTNYSYGRVEIENSVIHFVPAKDLKPIEPTPSRPGVLTPAEWVPAYEGRFLVHKDSLKSFADYYGGFRQFNGFPRLWNCDCGPFAERKDKDIDFDRNAHYILPPQYMALVKEPIEGEVISVGERHSSNMPVFDGFNERSSVTRVTLNVGSRDGVRKGMFFFLEPDFDGTNQIVKVTYVSRRSSEALVIRHVDKSGNEKYEDWKGDNESTWVAYPKLQPGLKITTRILLESQD